MTHQSNRFRFEHALHFAEFLERAQKHAQLWRDTYRLTKSPDELVARASAIPGRWHLLVMVEDWCGDAVNTVPHLARLAERAPNFELRVIGRDDNAELMDAHLTNGSRSIPVVIVLDAGFVERGWWGPRPSELQHWVVTVGKTMEKDERYRHVRTWYARDRGRTTLDEIVSLVERASDCWAAA
jgi:hypothetical protein